MSSDGLRFRWRDEGSIAGILAQLTAGDPVPALPLDQTTGLLAVDVAVGAIVTLWQASVSPITGFDFLYVMAGAYPTDDALETGTVPALAGQLEMTVKNGDAAEQIWIEQLRAGFPYRRFSDVGRYNITPGGSGFDGTANVVDLLRYKNDTTAIVTLRYFLAKAPA